MPTIEHDGEQVCFDEAIFIDKVKHLTLNDGDVLVLEYPGIFTEMAVERLRREVEEFIHGHMGKNVKAVVFEEGLTLSAVLTNAKEGDK